MADDEQTLGHEFETAPPESTENNKRSFEDGPGDEETAKDEDAYNTASQPSEIDLAKQRASEIAARLAGGDAQDAKRARTEDAQPGDDSLVVNGSGKPQTISEADQTDGAAANFLPQDTSESSRMEVPNSKVGLVIGKGGETIKYLQQASGARIQVTRDAEADPGSTSRIVELVGNPEQIAKAEQLITDVISEAGPGGSGALIARGFGGLGPPGEQVQIKVPNNKVGLIIGRGGETIKNLQNRSGARIQVQSDRELEPGATERLVTLIGNKKATDAAEALVREVTSDDRPRGPPAGGGATGFNQGGGFNNRGGPPQAQQAQAWGPPAAAVPPTYPGYQQQQPYSAQPYPGAAGGQYGYAAAPTAYAAAAPGAQGTYDYYGQQAQAAGAAAAPTDPYYGQQGYYGYQQPYAAAAGYGQQAYPGYGQQQAYPGYDPAAYYAQQQGYQQQSADPNAAASGTAAAAGTYDYSGAGGQTAAATASAPAQT